MSSGLDRLHFLRALGWGLFLACSWTWVIGLFLPVYLVRDFGWPGWAAFAVPNVIGAAMVGVAWRREGSSEAFVQRNAGMMRAFSVWTILFHITFIGWMLALCSQMWLDDWGPGGLTLGILILVALGSGALGSRAYRGVAVVVYLVTWGLLFAAWRTSDTIGLPPATGLLGAKELALLFPAIAFGFLLCPHLDLTLHRARQECPGATGTSAFFIGFGVLFLGMITVSLLYAGAMSRGSFSLYIIGIIALQGVFTMGAHFRELFEGTAIIGTVGDTARSRRRRCALWSATAMLGLTIALTLVAALSEGWIQEFLDPKMSVRELVYKCFLAPYGLLFPAWMWIVSSRPEYERGVRIGLWTIAAAVGAPCLWLGLIQGPFEGEPAMWYWLLPVGAAIPAMTPLALRFVAKRVESAAA